MSQLERSFDWHEILRTGVHHTVVAEPRRRMSVLKWLLLILVGIIATRCFALELASGTAFRAIADRHLAERTILPATRGRIVDRAGAELAADRNVPVIKIHYRYLQQPLEASWLRREAGRLLPAGGSHDKKSIDASADQLSGRIVQMHRRIAVAGGMSQAQWRDRCRTIQLRIERMANDVNRRRAQSIDRQPSATADDALPDSWGRLVRDSFFSMFSPPAEAAPRRIAIREQSQHHLVLANVTDELAAEVEANHELYPGVVVQQEVLRTYPMGSLAAHALGYTTSSDGEAPQGRAGVESVFDDYLDGVAGFADRPIDSESSPSMAWNRRLPTSGKEVRLTLDVRLQRTAEQLLDDACRLGIHRRRRQRLRTEQPTIVAGGSVVVIDIHSGELLALASSPRFDPNDFASRNSAAIERWLSDPQQSMFDRSIQMAITPGSVFKPLVAIAMLQSEVLDPEAPFICRGYLRQPDRQRCQLFRRHGVGHGVTTLNDALAQSCNVYFYHSAHRLGPAALADWAARFGIGRSTGIELASESAGRLPSPRTDATDEVETGSGDSNGDSIGDSGAADEWSAADTEALAIGQGTLTVTPIQMARAMAAIANGGTLVTPRLTFAWDSPARDPRADGGTQDAGTAGETRTAGTPIADLSTASLAAVREGMRLAVSHPSGTAHRTVHLEHLPIAGKTGTAQTVSGAEDHAWFAGYAPADRPQVVFVVAIAHGGSGAEVCGPIVRQLADKANDLGYLAE